MINAILIMMTYVNDEHDDCDVNHDDIHVDDDNEYVRNRDDDVIWFNGHDDDLILMSVAVFLKVCAAPRMLTVSGAATVNPSSAHSTRTTRAQEH